MSWNDLSLKEKAAYIKIGVKNGLTNVDDIRNKYNKFDEGGFTLGDGSLLNQDNTDYRPNGYIENPDDWYNNGEVTQLPEVSVYGNKPTFLSKLKVGFNGAISGFKNHMQQPSTPMYESVYRVQMLGMNDSKDLMKSLLYIVPFLGTALSAKDIYDNPNPSALDYGLLGLSAIPDVGILLKQPIKNIAKLARIEKRYTGVPHSLRENKYMDDNFLDYNGEVWSSNSPEFALPYARRGSEPSTEGKIYELFYDPKDFVIGDTPTPYVNKNRGSNEFFLWSQLPFEYKGNTKKRIIKLANVESTGKTPFSDNDYIMKNVENNLEKKGSQVSLNINEDPEFANYANQKNIYISERADLHYKKLKQEYIRELREKGLSENEINNMIKSEESNLRLRTEQYIKNLVKNKYLNKKSLKTRDVVKYFFNPSMKITNGNTTFIPSKYDMVRFHGLSDSADETAYNLIVDQSVFKEGTKNKRLQFEYNPNKPITKYDIAKKMNWQPQSDVLKTYVPTNGLYNVFNRYNNEYADGGFTAGNIVDGLYSNSKEKSLGTPSHNYDFVYTDSMNKYKPDYRGHYPDNVKKPSHPTSPLRGYFYGGNNFELSERGLRDPNYTIFGLVDNGDRDVTVTHKGATVLPEITVTPRGSYYRNNYDNIKYE